MVLCSSTLKDVIDSYSTSLNYRPTSKMIADTSSSLSHDVSTSTATVENCTLDISFEDITYTVPSGLCGRGRKAILRGLSGSFLAGELSAIVGQSGAGKSTLMDVLAGYATPCSGVVMVNGRRRNEKWFRRRSCYIMQNDMLHEFLTVRESLALAADLKLGNHLRRSQKNQRIEEVIVALGLAGVRHTRGGSLSGGQKKRLAIALELISDPPIMFLDEPTSGLDISSTKQLMYLLRGLARQGRTLVVTVHQPSTPLLALVDRLYAVKDGCCAYIGSVPQLVPYLDSMDLPCPPYHNPVDFLIEICSGAQGQKTSQRLVHESVNGKTITWIDNAKLDDLDLIIDNSILCDDLKLTALPPPKAREKNGQSEHTYATSHWTQFCILTSTALSMIWRDPGRTTMIASLHCLIAILISSLFYDIGREAGQIMNNYRYLCFSQLFIMFTAFCAVTISFPTQLPVVRREHFNRWYSAGAYFMAAIMSSLPMQTVCVLIYGCTTYWFTGQPLEWQRFFAFSWILIEISYVAMCIGFLNGSIFNVKNGVIFGPFFIMPFLIFSGFLLRMADTPWHLHWLFHISFLKHGLVGLSLSIYGMDRPKLTCEQTYCHYRNPSQFLKDVGIESDHYHLVVGALSLIAFIVIVSAYLILKYRLKKRW